MKAFVKWWNEEQSQELTEEFLIENNLTTQEQAVDLLAKTAWRAALKWALKNEREYTIFKEFSDKKSIPMVGADIIRKELEDE